MDTSVAVAVAVQDGCPVAAVPAVVGAVNTTAFPVPVLLVQLVSRAGTELANMVQVAVAVVYSLVWVARGEEQPQ